MVLPAVETVIDQCMMSSPPVANQRMLERGPCSRLSICSPTQEKYATTQRTELESSGLYFCETSFPASVHNSVLEDRVL